MTANELRELAEFVYNCELSKIGRHEVANYLRACADAMDAGPVAWLTSPHGVIQANPAYHYSAPQSLDWRIPLYPLYPLAMPAPLRLPEPMTDAELTALWDAGVFTALRRTEAETLRRVQEVNK